MRRVVYDPLKCAACKSCEIQCSVSHSLSKDLLSAVSESPPSLPRVAVAWTPGMNVPLKCAHCETAPCMLGCPVGAIRRDAGSDTVQIDDSRCIGCFSCVLVCPYGAVRLSFDRKRAYKCDGCVERLRAGEEPACASSCPTHALAFREIEEVASQNAASAAMRETAALLRGRETAGGEASPLEAILRMREEMARG
ncbi:MAG: 4Fe-4S dicluster domain-containing protein [Deltaproteobacteria bacterium]|nr:4Fe-4S dicluster domain-containing protein [Deltaproteobacteria bacterium]